MSDQVHAPDEQAVAVAAPSWIPHHDAIEQLWRVGLFSADDAHALRQVWRILKGQTDDYLDRLFGMAAAYPPLCAQLNRLRDGIRGREPSVDAATMRRWFRRWLFETCLFPQDLPWLRQLPIELAPEPSTSAIPLPLPEFRYVIALAFPLVLTARPFFVANGGDHQEIERLQQALLKAVLLQTALLGKLYVKDGLW
ncbi:MAG TPA: hypothetical protein PKI41_15505 [Candidatus Competibacteraceae bacterium]|nr:MAG: hypothetical protein EKK71_00085 [Candidatus Competibacteraceae bacterium]HOB63500.1 hypothetical protein [Candidatus Competibacteraceae bacterium]HQA25538.1 hypothetical protein [Candidatus Competibacteraceae bacterium]HQD57945.1 hypothetical protein [Candidatus Competibacteraceae bacterium]